MDQQRNFLAWVTGFKMLIAGAIAFALVTFFHLPEGLWALVTIAAVTQSGSDLTKAKLFMRTIGTLLGALVGYGIALVAKSDPTLTLTCLFFLIWVTSYIAVQPTTYSYAGIVAGMTVAIIVFFSLANENYYQIAISRTAEVLLGVFVLAFVNFALYFTLKYYFPQKNYPQRTAWVHPDFRIQMRYLISSGKVALACLATFLIWYYFKQPQGYWAALSCLLIMEENQNNTLKRGLFRFIAHCLAVTIGFFSVVALLKEPYAWRAIPLLITFFGCGYLIGKRNNYSSMGNTLGIAVSIMLLVNSNTDQTIAIIFERFYNVVIGIAVAFFMLALPLQFTKKQQGAPK